MMNQNPPRSRSMPPLPGVHQQGVIVKDLPAEIRTKLEEVISKHGQEVGNFAFAAVLSLAASGASLGAIRIHVPDDNDSEVIVGVALRKA